MGVEKNKAAREAAEAVYSLAVGESKGHGWRFWRFLIIRAWTHLPGKKRGLLTGKMTDLEAGRFGQTERMPFGEFFGKKVDEVPLDRLRWHADQTFTDDLRCYLNSDRVKGEVHDE